MWAKKTNKNQSQGVFVYMQKPGFACLSEFVSVNISRLSHELGSIGIRSMLAFLYKSNFLKNSLFPWLILAALVCCAGDEGHAGKPVTKSCDCSSTSISQTIQVTTLTTVFSPGTLGDLERVVASHSGRMGISARNLDTGETFEINAETAFPTASTIKLPVMVAAMNRLGQPESPVPDYYKTMRYDAGTSTGGSGIIQNFRDGSRIEFKELIHLMITVSDNIATNMVTEWIGGPKVVNRWLADHDYQVMRMNSTIGGRLTDLPDLRREWGIGVTTPCEMRRLSEMIVLGEAGSTSITEEMIRILGNQYWDDLILAEVPPMVWAGAKSGALSQSRSDVAIVASPGGRFVLAVFTANNSDVRWTADNDAEEAIRAVSRIVYRHFNPDSSYVRPAGMEKF
jgi:beta-lactamase class A